MASEPPTTPEARAAETVKNFTDVAWHTATFVIINVFLWLILPSRAAFWITVGSGVALAFHIAYYVIGDGGPGNRRYQTFLAQERAREEREST